MYVCTLYFGARGVFFLGARAAKNNNKLQRRLKLDQKKNNSTKFAKIYFLQKSKPFKIIG